MCVREEGEGAIVHAEFTSLHPEILHQLLTMLLAPQTLRYTDTGHQRHSIWKDQFYVTLGHG